MSGESIFCLIFDFFPVMPMKSESGNILLFVVGKWNVQWAALKEHSVFSKIHERKSGNVLLHGFTFYYGVCKLSLWREMLGQCCIAFENNIQPSLSHILNPC